MPFWINYWIFHLKGLWANDTQVWDLAVKATHALNVHLVLQRGLNPGQNGCTAMSTGGSRAPCAPWLPRRGKEPRAARELRSPVWMKPSPAAAPEGTAKPLPPPETAPLLSFYTAVKSIPNNSEPIIDTWAPGEWPSLTVISRRWFCPGPKGLLFWLRQMLLINASFKVTFPAESEGFQSPIWWNFNQKRVGQIKCGLVPCSGLYQEPINAKCVRHRRPCSVINYCSSPRKSKAA